MIVPIFFCIIVFLLQFLLAWGIMKRFLRHKRIGEIFAVCVIGGMGFNSVSLFLLEMVKVPLTNLTNLLFLVVLVLLVNYPFKDSIEEFKSTLSRVKIRIKPYNLIPFLCIAIVVFASVWRNNYTPVTPFDAKVGIDLVAKYAAMEGTISNSVFHEHMTSVWYWSNQPYYAPFTTLMQIVFRLTGLEFGKVWLSVIFITFLFFLYQKLRDSVHPFLAIFLVMIYIANAELFAYTFLMQTDFCNSVFFIVGLVYLKEYYFGQEKSRNLDLWLSGIFMIFAVWSRSETIFFLPLAALFILHKERKGNIKTALIKSSIYMAAVLVPFVLWNFIYINLYLPLSPDVGKNLVTDFPDYFGTLLTNVDAMNNSVIFNGIYWNYSVRIFLIYFGLNFVLSLVVFRKIKGAFYIIWMLAMYVVFALLIQHFIAVGVSATFRRGFFKFFPMMVLFMAQSSLLGWVSEKLEAFSPSSTGTSARPKKKLKAEES